MKNTKNLQRGFKLGVDLNIMVFADGVVILAQKSGNLAYQLKNFIESCKKGGLELNEEKKTIHFGQNANNRGVNFNIANF